MVEVGSYWKFTMNNRDVVQIVAIDGDIISISSPNFKRDYITKYTKIYFLRVFEKLTPLEMELL